MVLSEQEESLISIVRGLPPDQAVKVLDWARQLADLADGRTIEWSDNLDGRGYDRSDGGCDTPFRG